MLYKVTPMLPAAVDEKAKKAREPGQPRKKRKTAIYDGDGQEVLITLMCLKCRSMRPLAQFGLRKMADGAIRNQPWCRPCRGGAGVKKPKSDAPILAAVANPVQVDEAPERIEVALEAAPLEASGIDTPA